MAGHRKATEYYCQHCEAWHPTHRTVTGLHRCEATLASIRDRLEKFWAAPRVKVGQPRSQRT